MSVQVACRMLEGVFIRFFMQKLSTHILAFHHALIAPNGLASEIAVLNPWIKEEVRTTAALFYEKYYSDTAKRTFIFGINPGRFGSGITAIGFTDPVRLETMCGIENPYQKKAELSSEFVYQVIGQLGGPENFFRQHYITAVCPLGFTKHGKNYNYYDDPHTLKTLTSYIVDSIKAQLTWGLHRPTAVCLGEGKNYVFLSKLNEEHHFFKDILSLPHPRWVMQYARPRIEYFVGRYVEVLRSTA